MEKSLLVNVGKSFCHLSCYVPDLMIFQFFAFLASLSDEFVEVFFDVLKN
jgi:hypothetical protein